MFIIGYIQLTHQVGTGRQHSPSKENAVMYHSLNMNSRAFAHMLQYVCVQKVSPNIKQTFVDVGFQSPCGLSTTSLFVALS